VIAGRRVWTAIAAVSTVVALVVVVAATRQPASRGTTAFRPDQPQVRLPRVSEPFVSKGPPFAVGGATSREVQSRAWFAAGSWWGLLGGARGGQHIFELTPADHGWRDTGVVVDSRPRSSGDTLWDGQHLVIATRTAGGAIQVSRFTFSPPSRTFTLDPRFPVKVAGLGTLAVTIARDGAGLLWTTFVQQGRVWVAHSTGDDATWAPATFLPTAPGAVKEEDVTVVTAFAGRIGVLWSDQVTGAFRFTTHEDGAPATAWSETELPLAAPLAADNHLSMKAAADGRLFAVVKTSFGDRAGRPGAAQIVLLERSIAGAWTPHPVAAVSDGATRGMVLLDDADEIAFVLFTAPERGGSVYMKAASYNTLRFPSGRGQRVLAATGAVIEEASTGKQPVTRVSGIVVLGADQKASVYYRADIPLTDRTPR
jgi:hypothetical protein